MVRRVFGKCDSHDVVFTLNDSGRWETVVPFDMDGEYVVELWAEDIAGNVGYFAKILFALDTSKLCVDIKILDIAGNVTVEDVKAMFSGGKYGAEFNAKEYSGALAAKRYDAEVIRCELCGRW